ncbi:DinB family protein [Pseudomonas sp. JM0905a]|uniref:DinB family protein n=1 Tax=Metapseudomonas resinovorans TaxID=53412 RepID=A0ABT4Y380_METRE|nr:MULTISPECIES: DinB family protein [Pseudomonas]MBD2836183.1 DinB family protein [Pseudomonas sp. JM0905a]MDA8483304.1 DinB family protein [Pseudomonas resinovorans]
MINAHTARMLAHYKQWVDERLFDDLAGLPPGEVGKERVSLCKSILGTLNHIYVIDCIWRAHLEGKPHPYKTRLEVPHPELAELREAQASMDEWFISWSAGQSDASLAEPVEFVFCSGDPGVMMAGAMLMHVVNHASYHRGCVIQMYAEIPAKPPITDLPVFLRETHPRYAAG